MGDINFDKASVGNVSSSADALSVTNTDTGNGVAGNSTNGMGVTGNGGIAGVFGGSPTGDGVFGQSSDGFGVRGDSVSDSGVHGESIKGAGVSGQGGRFGVSGSGAEVGVFGSSTRTGVAGQTRSNKDAGVNGRNDGNGFGVFGFGQRGSGVEGHSTDGTGVVGFSEKGLAGRFIGNVEVTGDIRLANADFAEEFYIKNAATVEPGTVMVLNAEGGLQSSQQAYDKLVAGVISGADKYKPAIILDKQAPQDDRMPLALVGKAYCKVDAQYASIEVGDLLTTSPTPGHAMKADDLLKAFGAVIGKALRPLPTGLGLIPILIALQ